jgi:hypothetical protein
MEIPQSGHKAGEGTDLQALTAPEVQSRHA